MAKDVHITRHKGRQLLITWDNVEIVNKITGMPETLVNSVNLNMLQYYQNPEGVNRYIFMFTSYSTRQIPYVCSSLEATMSEIYQ